MSGPDPLFREEAVEWIRRGRGTGDVVRVAPRWTAIAFSILVAVAVGAIVTASVVKVDRVLLAPAVADQGSDTVRAVVPESDAPAVGEQAEFSVTRTGDTAVVHVTEIGPAQGVEGAPKAVPVTAKADGTLPAGAGVLEIKVGEKPLIADLIPGNSSER